MKWTKLDIAPQEQQEDKSYSLDNQHPFMKVCLQLSDRGPYQTFQSITETGELSEAEQLTGAPIHYNANSFPDHVVPGDNQSQYYYCDYPSPDHLTYVDTPTTYYPQAQYYQPGLYPGVQDPAAPPLQPVQYVPYYYYYPVPAETYHNTNLEQQICQPLSNSNNNINLINNNTIPHVQVFLSII